MGPPFNAACAGWLPFRHLRRSGECDAGTEEFVRKCGFLQCQCLSFLGSSNAAFHTSIRDGSDRRLDCSSQGTTRQQQAHTAKRRLYRTASSTLYPDCSALSPAACIAYKCPGICEQCRLAICFTDYAIRPQTPRSRPFIAR